MKGITTIGLTVLLFAALGGNLRAQQSSSAVQTVTFGVSRTSQMVVQSFASLPNEGSFTQVSDAKTFQRKLAIIPAKITFSSETPGGPSAGRSTLSRQALSQTNLLAARSDAANSGKVQQDLRTFLQQNGTLRRGVAPLVLTITD